MFEPLEICGWESRYEINWAIYVFVVYANSCSMKFGYSNESQSNMLLNESIKTKKCRYIFVQSIQQSIRANFAMLSGRYFARLHYELGSI